MVELQIVILAVAGSSPVGYPTPSFPKAKGRSQRLKLRIRAMLMKAADPAGNFHA
jgi:hypothetical protein